MKLVIKKQSRLVLAIGVLIAILSVGVVHQLKPLPEAINFEGKEWMIQQKDITFLSDLTYLDNKELKHNQEIFKTVFNIIDHAQTTILMDMFLFNAHQGKSSKTYLPLARQLTDKLIARKKEMPAIRIDFITDPINSVYGGAVSQEIQRLQTAGINVIVTDLNKLRDSNPIYSTFWRLLIKWFKNNTRPGWLPHPFSTTEPKVSLRSYLSLLNFKANHRKLIVADQENDMVTLVTSANPHNASSFHSNVALVITGHIWQDLYTTENAVAKLGGQQLSSVPNHQAVDLADSEKVKVKLITEKKIKDRMVDLIDHTQPNDEIKIAMFYLSERKIIKSLIKAAKRQVGIKLILDPNKDAFGYEKNGIPNRVVAHELVKKSRGRIKIKWYATHGEQFHTKMVVVNKQNRTSLVLGSANLTRRNIGNYNLETDIMVSGESQFEVMKKVNNYFNLLWNNEDNKLFTQDYAIFADRSIWKYLWYRLQEFTGFCSF